MELPKAYDPKQHEAKLYQLWEKSGAFEPAADSKAEPYTIIMPPPNANGDFHLGHAQYTIEDIMIRYQRMRGRAALWLPGTDHAGIETQFVYERDVLAPEGKTRFDLGPEKFFQAAYDFTRKFENRTLDSMRSLGLSADWSRYKFTLDNDITAEVYETFVKLFKDGLVYRGNRLVNWCPRCRSGFADVEIKHMEREDQIYTLDYGSVKIATTRPETIFADSAVAVNPTDPRFKKLIGQTATIPLLDRPVPIIADDYVDPKFGTGALKITPGHDPNDYEIGLRHQLPEITVIDFEGRMINVPEELTGLTVEEARVKTVDMLKSAGKLIKTQNLTHSVGYHDRCGTIIEPLITEQWFLRVKPLVAEAMAAVKDGRTTITPKSFEKVYLNWLENLHDWNISRQNWYGMRIPIYYKTSNDPDKEAYIAVKTEAEARAYYGTGNYRQETDIFDTWFSSSQWPYVTLMTTRPGDFKRFYPTDLMGTARDILTKWVVTMMMMGLYRTGEVPFRHVYLWGMVNDEHGKKMSKSKGNTISPLGVSAKYGTDALRLALTIGITPGNDGSLSEKKIEGYRNFCNKLWNVARFVLAQTDKAYSPTPPQPANLADEWILDRLARATKKVAADIDKYRFSDAGQTVYSLLWNDFADWYVEASKSETNLSVLVYGLETILKLAHPFAPFVTEAIWQNMAWQKQNLISTAWPTVGKTYSTASDFETIRSLVGQIRNLKGELGLEEATLLHQNQSVIADNQHLLERLAGISRFEVVEEGRGLALSGLDGAWLDVSPQQLKSYLDRLQQLQKQQADYVHKLTSQLNNRAYVKAAPGPVVDQTRQRLVAAESELTKLNEQIKVIQR